MERCQTSHGVMFGRKRMEQEEQVYQTLDVFTSTFQVVGPNIKGNLEESSRGRCHGAICLVSGVQSRMPNHLPVVVGTC